MSAQFGVFDKAQVLQRLWESASPSMALDELRWFAAGAAQQVVSDARLLSVVLEGIGCLVQADRNGQDVGSGALQSRQEVSDLVLFAAEQAKALQGMAEIASQAAGQVDHLQRCARRPSD